MSILNSIKSFGDASKSFQIDSNNYRGDWGYSMDGNGHNYFKYEGLDSSLTAYRKCPPVTAIINKKAQAFINGKTWLLNTSGKAKGKEATSAEAQKIKALFSQPNALQSGKQFEAQNYIYQQLAGYVVVLPIKPLGFSSLVDTSSLWNIPPHLVEIKENRFKPYQINKASDLIESITIVSNGERTPLNVDEVIIIKDFTPSFGSHILPDSRIKSLEMPINNIIGAYESRNVLINSRGPMYIVSSNQSDDSGNVSLVKGEKEALLQEFKQRYGLTRKQSTAIITSANINVQSVGFPTKDLMLFEEVEGSTMAICDNFGYPYRLMAAEKAASYNDVSEFKKMLYQDTIIPEGESTFEQWDRLFNTAEYNIRFDKDYSHIPALQADALQMATARKARNEALEREYRYDGITLNRWRELNGEDPVTGGDLFFSQWIAAGNKDPYAKDAGMNSSAQQENQTNGTANAANAG